MDRTEIFSLLSEVLEVPAGSLQGTEELQSFEGWDSLKIMGLIALVDERCGVVLSPQKITDCATVNDLAETIAR